METVAITVVGPDRPGIVADVTAVVAELDGNIEDSSMTLLQGSFAWMLVVALPGGSASASTAFEPLRASSLTIDVVTLPAAPAVPPDSPSHSVAVHGADRPGIVAAVTRVIADRHGNITDLSTRLAGPLYVMAVDVALPASAEQQLRSDLAEVAELLDVEIAMHKIEIDEGF